MAGFDLDYQRAGTIPGGLRFECGDVSYSEITATNKSLQLPTTLTHIVAGILFQDSSNHEIGRAGPRVGEISYGQLCFSISDPTATGYYVTYMAVGW